MAFSRLFSSFKAAVPAFARRRPFVTAAMSYIAISYAAPPLIRSFTTANEQNNDDDPRRPFRAMDLLYPSRMWSRFLFSLGDRRIKVTEMDEPRIFTETEDHLIWRFNLAKGDVNKEDVEVLVDHRNTFRTLRINDVVPGFNRFEGLLHLTDKIYDADNITAKLENNVLKIVIPKLKKKKEDEEIEEKNEDFIVRRTRVNVE